MMKKMQLTYLLVGVLALASCARSLVDEGYKNPSKFSQNLATVSSMSSMPMRGNAGIDARDMIMGVWNVPKLGYGDRHFKTYDHVPNTPIKRVDNTYYYQKNLIKYEQEYEKQTMWAKVAAQVVYDSVQTEPVLNMYVFDTPKDSLVIYGGTEGMVPRVRNEKKGEWMFEGEVALTPTRKDKAAKRERYMKYKLTFSPDKQYPRVQSHKVRTRKVK